MTDVVDMQSGIRTGCRPDEWVIARIADHQHGVVTRRQLREAGFHESSIRRRIAAGRLHPLHAGVYAVGRRGVSRHGRWLAAVLACGDGALACGQTAAAVWGVLLTAGSRVDVTARTRRGRPGIVLHGHRHIHPEDRAACDGIPVTSIPRTLLDLARAVSRRRLSMRQLRRAVEAAEVRGVFDLDAMERFMTRSRGRPGVRALRAALETYRPPVFTRSELERRFLDLCESAGLPRPAVNFFVEGKEADMVWLDERLVVELDGHETHRTRAAFEDDRVRDATLQLAGYRVLRVTHGRLQRAPARVAQTVRFLLDRRSS